MLQLLVATLVVAPLVLSVFATVLTAQQQPAGPRTEAAGRVIRIRTPGDTLAASGVRVLLHRVSSEAQGPADSAVTDAQGRFRIAFTADSGALFLLSAAYAGLEYFSPALATDPARPDTTVVITVADTSAAQPVGVAVRQIVITAPERDGTRQVLDLIQLDNDGPYTRVSPDSVSPSWAMPLPPGVFDFQAGPGDIGPDAIEEHDGALHLLSPIPPGPKELLVQYTLPAGVTVLPLALADSVEQLEVLFEEARASVAGGGVERVESREVEGRTFTRWSGAPGAGVIEVRLPPTGEAARWSLVALVAVMALALGAAAWLVRRRRAAPADAAPPAEAPAPGSSATLADEAAALDARYAGREGEVDGAEWEAYQSERRRLTAEIAAALARERGRM